MFDPQIPYNDLPFISEIMVSMTDDLIKLREDTRVAIELLNYALSTMQNPESLIDTFALQEAKVSSKIENIRTTNEDIFSAVAFKTFTEESKAVSDYKDALMIGFELLKNKGQLGIGDLEYINTPVNQVGRGVRSNLANFGSVTRITKTVNDTEEVIYTPPHGRDLLIYHLLDMVNYIYNDEEYPEHPLIKIALAHCQFENIHPFKDGNGRTGRILNILFLCQKGYLSSPVLYASSFIMKNKSKYYEVLRTSKESGDYTEAISYMLTSFKETANHTRKIIEEINRTTRVLTLTEDNDPAPPKSEIRRYFTDGMTGNRKVLCDVIRFVMDKPFVRNCDIVEAGLAHRQTSAVYLDQLVDKGILSKEKIGKENIYKNVKLLELFDKDSDVKDE